MHIPTINYQHYLPQGIVAAVRQFGGRFLDLDERTNIYTDIGDKKATEKTSQALREGQTKIRQDAYKNKDTGMQPTLPPPPISPDGKWEISGEGYVEYSVKVLHELYKAEDNMTPEMAARPAPHSVATQLGLGVQKRKEHNRSKGGGRIVSSDNNTMPVLPPIVSTPAGVSSAHMAAVYDQFDGMVPVQSQQQQQQQATTHPNMPPNLPRPAVPSSGSPMRETMSSQVTDISRLSLSEILRLTANGERGTTDPFTNQLVELVRQSNSELMQSGLGRDSSIRFTGRGDEILPNKEDDDAAARPSESTTNSSLMQRDTVLSFAPYDEYSTPSTSAQSGQQQQQQQESARMSSDRMSVMSVDNNDEANDVAEMLIRLSRDSEKKSGGAAMMEI